ncbi:MAG: hypothetical protein ACJAZS_000562 [Alteromonas naphthalenivorans]|jgi:hypothetical protein
MKLHSTKLTILLSTLALFSASSLQADTTILDKCMIAITCKKAFISKKIRRLLSIFSFFSASCSEEGIELLKKCVTSASSKETFIFNLNATKDYKIVGEKLELAKSQEDIYTAYYALPTEIQPTVYTVFSEHAETLQKWFSF